MGRCLFHAIILCCAAPCAGTAVAAECPDDQRGVEVRTSGPSETVGQDSAVLLGQVMLGQGVEDRVLRLRRVVLAPGAQVAWHEHKDRSLLFLVESGAMTEYRSDCRGPIEHAAGSTVQETIGTKHWWRNEGPVPAVMLLADITTPDAVDKVDLPGAAAGPAARASPPEPNQAPGTKKLDETKR